MTGAAGVAITFLLDNLASRKTNTLMRLTLQSLALGTVYWSLADQTLALAAVAAVMAASAFGWLPK